MIAPKPVSIIIEDTRGGDLGFCEITGALNTPVEHEKTIYFTLQTLTRAIASQLIGCNKIQVKLRDAKYYPAPKPDYLADNSTPSSFLGVEVWCDSTSFYAFNGELVQVQTTRL